MQNKDDDFQNTRGNRGEEKEKPDNSPIFWGYFRPTMKKFTVADR
jgi:hypothetical protein